MATKNFIIYEGNIERAEKKLASIKSRANKKNISMAYSIKEYDMVKVDDKYYQRYFVVVNYKPIGINGFKPIALLEDVEGANMIHLFSEDIEIDLNHYGTVHLSCEHCNSKHNRKYAVLIQHMETGIIKQIGKSCLKEYTDGYNIESILSYYQSMDELVIDGTFSSSEPSYYNLKDLLAVTIEKIKEEGRYLGRQKAWDMGLESTLEHVLVALPKANYSEYPDEVHEALKWIATNDNSESSYLSNLEVAVKNGEYVAEKHLGFVVSLIPSYRNHLKKSKGIEDDKKEIVNEFFGNIGERLELDLFLKRSAWYETMFGITNIYVFEDSERRCFVWKTTKNLEAKDEAYRIKGTIKEHSDYDGRNQTVLTRCAILEDTV